MTYLTRQPKCRESFSRARPITLSVEFTPDDADKYFSQTATVAISIIPVKARQPQSSPSPADPLVHVEPDSGFIDRDKGTNGLFTLALDNTGYEDISDVVIYSDYFVAKKYPEIRITRIGGYSINPDIKFQLVRKHTIAHFKLDFSNKIDDMWAFAALGNHADCLGARVKVTYRRRSDGKEFNTLAIYGVGYKAFGIYTVDHRGIGTAPELEKATLSLREVEPYLLSTDRWTDAVFDVNAGHFIDPN